MKRILITGGLGFIGQHLANELAPNNWVSIIDSKKTKSVQDSFIEDYKPDVIYHLAATARLGVSLEHPSFTLQNNMTSTLHVLDYCKRNPNVKLIVVSSSSAKHAQLTRNPYALSKAIGEQLVDTYRNLYQVQAVSVRLFNVYGPGEMDGGKYTTLLKQCKKGLKSGEGFYIEGDGSIIRDYTHVEDVVQGLIAVEKDMDRRPAWPLYELGSGEASVTVKHIVEEFQKGTTLPIEWRSPRVGDPQYTNADRVLAPTGWQPKHDVLTYIKDWKDRGCPDD